MNTLRMIYSSRYIVIRKLGVVVKSQFSKRKTCYLFYTIFKIFLNKYVDKNGKLNIYNVTRTGQLHLAEEDGVIIYKAPEQLLREASVRTSLINCEDTV